MRPQLGFLVGLPFLASPTTARAQRTAPPRLPAVRTVASPLWQCLVPDGLRARHESDAAICDADFAASAIRAAAAAGALEAVDASCAFTLAANIERSTGLIAAGDTTGARAMQRTLCGGRVLTRDSLPDDPALLLAACPGVIWSWTERAARCIALPIGPAEGAGRRSGATTVAADADRRAAKAFAAGEHRRAIEEARRALAADRRDAFAHALIGGAELTLGSADSAIVELRAALPARPGDPWVRERLADALLRVGNDSAALAAADSALLADGTSVYARRVLGTAQARLGRVDEGLATLDLASRIAPGDPMPWIDMARINDDARRWAAAEVAARSALRLRDDELAHLLLARALAAEGRVADARRELRRVLELAPWEYDARAMLDSLRVTGGS